MNLALYDSYDDLMTFWDIGTDARKQLYENVDADSRENFMSTMLGIKDALVILYGEGNANVKSWPHRPLQMGSHLAGNALSFLLEDPQNVYRVSREMLGRMWGGW